MEEQTRLSPDLPEPKGSGPLAIVGGGSSLSEHLAELRSFPGDIWAINQTADYLRGHGIDCYFFTVDPSDTVSRYVSGKAVLHAHCHPDAFRAAGVAYKTVGSIPGPSTAVAGCLLGLKAGYDKIYLFGADSSYGKTSHVYRDEPIPGMVRVECGGSHITKLEMILQAERLAETIRALPQFFENRSGGFLKALVEHGDYDVTHASRSVHEGKKHVPEPALPRRRGKIDEEVRT